MMCVFVKMLKLMVQILYYLFHKCIFPSDDWWWKLILNRCNTLNYFLLFIHCWIHMLVYNLISSDSNRPINEALDGLDVVWFHHREKPFIYRFSRGWRAELFPRLLRRAQSTSPRGCFQFQFAQIPVKRIVSYWFELLNILNIYSLKLCTERQLYSNEP